MTDCKFVTLSRLGIGLGHGTIRFGQNLKQFGHFGSGSG